MPKHQSKAPRSTAPSQRQLRVGEVLRRALVEVLGRGELRDPALAETSITVSEVRASPDLKAATAFVMPLGGRDEAAVIAALDRAAPFLRGQVGQLAGLRFAPTLRFQPDRSFERAQAVGRLLDRIKARPDGAS